MPVRLSLRDRGEIKGKFLKKKELLEKEERNKVGILNIRNEKKGRNKVVALRLRQDEREIIKKKKKNIK